MSFGRWLLVHSFSIFLSGLFIFGYIYRSELQLEAAYQQLLSIESKAPTSTESVQPVTQSKSDTTDKNESIKANIKTIESKREATSNNDSKLVNSETVISYPTVSTIPVESSKESKSTELQVQDQTDRLYLARQAYWDKNYADAIYFYRQLIHESHNNPDYLGELGNIYYSLNDNQNASSLYYQAAEQYIIQNQPDRARLLVAPIIAMNRELGEKLKMRLQ